MLGGEGEDKGEGMGTLHTLTFMILMSSKCNIPLRQNSWIRPCKGVDVKGLH